MKSNRCRGAIELSLAALVISAGSLPGCGSPAKRQAAASTDATATTITPDTPVHIEERLDMAAKASDAGDYEAALAMFREVLAENPTVTDAYIGIGDVYMETQDYAKAEPAFDRAARLEPRNFDAQYGHGRALQMLNRLVEAIRAYHRALVIAPDHPQCNSNMATTYMQLGEPQNAVSFAERAVQLDPSSGPAHANLGAIYENLGRYADAVAQYDAAVELMEPTPPLLMNLINALSKEARYEEARNTAEVLIKLQPSANAYERLGWACFRLGNYGASLDSYRKGVEMDATHWPSLNGVGVNSLNAWLLSGKRDEASAREAKDAFQRSLRANPEQPKVRRLLTDYQF